MKKLTKKSFLEELKKINCELYEQFKRKSINIIDYELQELIDTTETKVLEQATRVSYMNNNLPYPIEEVEYNEESEEFAELQLLQEIQIKFLQLIN